MNDTSVIKGKDIDGKSISIGECRSEKFLMINDWELRNIHFQSNEIEYLHINYRDREKQFAHEKSEANLTEEKKKMFCTLPESVGNFTDLKVLDVHSYDKNIKIEDLNNNENIFLRVLPDSIGNLVNLRILNLSQNCLSSLPESIGNLQKLQELNLSKNCLSSLPESIGNLQKLQELNLSKNCLSSLPESIGNLQKLQELNLSYNPLRSLPNSIGNLKNLEELWLEQSGLRTLPDSIVNLKNLKKLKFDLNDRLYNELRYKSWLEYGEIKRKEYIEPNEIPKKIYDFLGNIEDLSLPKGMSIMLFAYRSNQENVVLRIHRTINTRNYMWEYNEGRRYKKYEEHNINIKSCGIPVDISTITGMKNLDARRVSVKKIPPSLNKLTKLETIDLRDNPDLAELPDFLWSMSNIREIHIDNKLIESVIVTARTIIDNIIENDKVKELLNGWKNQIGWSDEQLVNLLQKTIKSSPIRYRYKKT